MGDEGVPCHPTVITLLYSMRVSFYFDVSFDIHVHCDIPGGHMGARGIHIYICIYMYTYISLPLCLYMHIHLTHFFFRHTRWAHGR